MPTINHGAAFGGSASSLRSAAAYTGAVYNLNERYEKKLDERFKFKSYTDTAANLNNFSWANANAIVIETEGDGQINAYDFGAALGSRMGAIHEISDQRNVYQLQQAYAIREGYEKLYSDDKQNERKIQRILKNTNDNKLVPSIDKYRLQKWADGAGTTAVLTSTGPAISGTATALSSSNVVRALLTLSAMLDNMRVPEEGRIAFIGITDAVEMQLASELAYSPEYIKKGAVNGEVRRLGKLTVVAIPDIYMPTGAKIMVKWKGASADPRKLSWSYVYPHVEGHSGPVINGIYRYDSFVLAQKANGILVLGDSTAAPQATPTAALASGKITFTSASSTGIVYTIDGHNPKIEGNGTSVNLTTTTGTAVNAPTASCYVQAYAKGSNKVNSGIGKWFFDATAGTLTALSYDQEAEI